MQREDKFYLIPIFFILFFLAVQTGSANDMHIIGRLANGPVFDLLESNGYLFVSQGGEIRIYDVTTPEKIAQLNWTRYVSRCYSGDSIHGITLDGSHLFIAD